MSNFHSAHDNYVNSSPFDKIRALNTFSTGDPKIRFFEMGRGRQQFNKYCNEPSNIKAIGPRLARETLVSKPLMEDLDGFSDNLSESNIYNSSLSP
jgi:hypothetical protein